MERKRQYTVALAGNPNVGKSTVFNALTGMHQHTGNWPGKTVAGASGTFDTSVGRVELIDVPGTYSLSAHSPEEEVASEYICGKSELGKPDAVIIVCDACCLERNLILVLQIIAVGRPVLLCVNLIDEAKSRGIDVDFEKLSRLTGVPVIPCAARRGIGLDSLRDTLSEVLMTCETEITAEGGESTDFAARASHIASECVTERVSARERDRKLDRIFTGKYTALPTSVLLVGVVLFITLKGAVPISDGLAYICGYIETGAVTLFEWIGMPSIITSAICDGVLRILMWVISVMLPPMAVFFPLFTVLEDLGYLPRVAYNFDKCFKKCGACGKQALTMMMCLGCNAAGTTGCRIIDSPRERIIAILTGSFVPCNGRFPVIAAFISVIAVSAGVAEKALFSSLIMCLAVAVGIILTLFVSRVLSSTLLRGELSSFTLELPPYRIPKVGEVIVRSVFDRTLFVLGRAVAVAAPAGLLIWLLGNIKAGGVPLLRYVTDILDPIGRAAGMDGVMMCAFILALPAAEIIIPLMLMGYSESALLLSVQSFDDMAGVFAENGWTTVTAVCAVIFTLVHWPCSTTVITVYRETGSLKWTALSVLIPTLLGYALCVAVNVILGP